MSIFGRIKDFFIANAVELSELDAHQYEADTAGVHYNHAKITHKEAVRKMAEYGMSAKYNIHDKKWIVEYNRQMEVSESFREAVEAIKVD